MEKRALGKGLAALIGDKQAQAYNKPVPLFKDEPVKITGGILYLDTKEVSPGQFQPREDFNDEKLKDLIASVKEKGLLQPILVRKLASGFEIIAGERRFRAARALKLDKIPAIVKDVKDEDALIISLVENIQREGLNPIEEAHAFQKLSDKFSLSQDDISRAVGKDKTTVSNILRLLKLPADVQQCIVKEEITLGHAKLILGVSDIQKQKKLCQLTISKLLSVRELENIINVSLPTRKRKTISAQASDPHVANLERTLQVSLGTKVRIIAHKKRGKIVIEYYSSEDLERIINLLKKKISSSFET
ncbi:MAG: ParB/RepB/Spo0J family partition protein [Candidatus Omnitrophota bacterium]